MKVLQRSTLHRLVRFRNSLLVPYGNRFLIESLVLFCVGIRSLPNGEGTRGSLPQGKNTSITSKSRAQPESPETIA